MEWAKRGPWGYDLLDATFPVSKEMQLFLLLRSCLMAAPKSVKTAAQCLTCLVVQVVKNLPAVQETRVRFLGLEDPLEKQTATHSSMLAWGIPWTEEPGGLQSIAMQRVGQDCCLANTTNTTNTTAADTPRPAPSASRYRGRHTSACSFCQPIQRPPSLCSRRHWS